VLKWAGGKARLVPLIIERLPETMDTYYEPFAGSAAVFFALASRKRFRRAVLSDQNRELINVYRCLKRDVDGLIRLLREHQRSHSKDTYYDMRARNPNELDALSRAARTIYLNKTGFNGLYRVNRAGQFNVPLGRYDKPNICDEPRLRTAAGTLKRVRLEVRDFASACEGSEPGDGVYFDPPYVPLSRTSNFTAYHHEAFDDESQQRLASLFSRLAERSIAVLLSNSDTPRTRQLYKGWPIETIKVSRPINSKTSKRGHVAEVLVCGNARRR
jgi:DNA adenine methylase